MPLISLVDDGRLGISFLPGKTTYFVIYGARDAMDAQHKAKFSGGAGFDHRFDDLDCTVRNVEARLLH